MHIRRPDRFRRRRSLRAAALVLGIVSTGAVRADPPKVPDSVRRLATDLGKMPAATPDFTPAPGQRAVQVVLRVGAKGLETIGSTAIPIPASALERAEEKNASLRRRPYGWLVLVPAGGGAPIYWAPVEDPFVVLHEFTRPDGRLTGAKRAKRTGVMTARLPLVPGAKVVFVDSYGAVPTGWASNSFALPSTTVDSPFNPMKGGSP